MDSIPRAIVVWGRRVMPPWSMASPREARPTVAELRRRFGLFSFDQDAPTTGAAVHDGSFLGLGVRPGGIVEWLASPGAGALASALQVMPRHRPAGGVLAIVDPARECYAPALPGWGIGAGRTLFVRPTTRQ